MSDTILTLTLSQFGSALGHAAASAYERGQSATSAGLSGLEAHITETEAMNADIQKALDDLKTRVQANGDVEASAATAIQGIAQQLRDLAASNDPAQVVQAIKDLSTAVDQQATSLASAVTANTQAASSGGDTGTQAGTEPAPAPAPEPAPEPTPTTQATGSDAGTTPDNAPTGQETPI